MPEATTRTVTSPGPAGASSRSSTTRSSSPSHTAPRTAETVPGWQTRTSSRSGPWTLSTGRRACVNQSMAITESPATLDDPRQHLHEAMAARPYFRGLRKGDLDLGWLHATPGDGVWG